MRVTGEAFYLLSVHLVFRDVVAVLSGCLLVLGYQSLVWIFAHTPSYIFESIRMMNVLRLSLLFLAIVPQIAFIVGAARSF